MLQRCDRLDDLLDEILAQLRRHPAGVTEFELIRALDEAGVAEFTRAALSQPLSLYRTHFLLFHCLYRLQQRLEGEDLKIHCLRIQILPAQSAPQALDMPDPVRSFYLDLRNLDRVDEEQVLAMLGAFWRAFKGRSARAEALAVLELEDPVEGADIKRQYRRLVMRHHPDRGGDKTKLQEINAAMAALDG